MSEHTPNLMGNPSNRASTSKPRFGRKGQQIGITMRNYKRYLGMLLDTHWILEELELGVLDKVYDTVTGKHFFEKKIIKTKLGGVLDIQWIKERKPEEEFLEETSLEEEEEESSKLGSYAQPSAKGEPSQSVEETENVQP